MKIKQVPIRMEQSLYVKLKELSVKTRVPMQSYLREAVRDLVRKYAEEMK